MAQLTPQQFEQKYADYFADNEFQHITEATFRSLATDIKDSFAASTAVANVPDWVDGTYYPLGYVILHSFGGPAIFLKASQAGYLPAPTDPAGDTNWQPALSPAADNALYQIGTVDALRQAQGGWLPGRLYVLIARVDPATATALPDVGVRAASASQLEPAGFTLDSLSPATAPAPVHYDLATDTTTPSRSASAFADLLGVPADNPALALVLASLATATTAQQQRIDALVAGANGSLDTFLEAYNRFVADESVAAALNGQVSSLQTVQQQHTQQLNTLGVQAAPVMCYLADGTVAGFDTMDAALADKRTKVFMRTNVATVEVSTSNFPRGATNAGTANYFDASGSTVFVADGATFSLAGDSVDALLLSNFFFYFPNYGATGTGVVQLLSAHTSGGGTGQYPQLLNGYSAVPLQLSGGTYSLVNGYYASLTGTGTVHLFGSVQVDNLASGLTVVDHRATGGGSAAVVTAYLQIRSTSNLRVAEIPVLSPVTVLEEIFDQNVQAVEYQLDTDTRGARVYGTPGQARADILAALNALAPADYAAGCKLYARTVVLSPPDDATLILKFQYA